MPAQRRPGMDHEHHDWSPMSTRGVLRWPDNARVALCVIVTLEHTEWSPPEGSFSADLAGGLGIRPYPDYARWEIPLFPPLIKGETGGFWSPRLRDHRPRDFGQPDDYLQHECGGGSSLHKGVGGSLEAGHWGGP